MNIIKNFLLLLNREIPTHTLVKRGMKLGKNFNRQQGCFIDPTHCYLIEIGDDVTMSIRVTVMAHDASAKKAFGYTRLGKIKIGNRVFIGANATILPGVTIGDDAIIGAGSVVTHDVLPKTVVAGNPARQLSNLDEFLSKVKKDFHPNKNVFDSTYRMGNGLTNEKVSEISAAADRGVAFID